MLLRETQLYFLLTTTAAERNGHLSAIHHQRQDARRLKDLLDKRTQRTKELQKEVDDAKAAGGGSSERLKE
eukprot:COSAG04_NODE_21474_length_373_cov_0.799270_1_plen_70_part_10